MALLTVELSLRQYRAKPLAEEGVTTIPRGSTLPAQFRRWKCQTTVAAADQIVYSSWRHGVSRKDGDLVFLTDNRVLLENLRDELPVLCEQKKAEKCVPAEQDFIKANMLGFGDKIGAITNRITAMTELQSLFEPGSAEYEALEYRITAGQHTQQAAVDALKGIIAKPMPAYWHDHKKALETDDPVNVAVCADKKPYFMIYRYPELKKTYTEIHKAARFKCRATTGIGLNELLVKQPRTEEEQRLFDEYRRICPVIIGSGVVNRICKVCEDYFRTKKETDKNKAKFDQSILKSGMPYNRGTKDKIKAIYKEYTLLLQRLNVEGEDEEDKTLRKQALQETYLVRCMEACPDPEMLCNVVVDLCYGKETSKQFAWDMCGEQMVKNLLKRHGNTFVYPCRDKDGTIVFQGYKYGLREVTLPDCEGDDGV